MSKVVTEVALGAAAISLAILMPPAGLALLGATLTPGMFAVMGASLVLGGIADALGPGNPRAGLAVGVTTPIGPWNYVYGTQKVGGVEIFRESNNSQGTSNNKELHRVYVLACHPCALGAWQLRIDGKQVLLTGNSSTGWNSYSPTQIQWNIQTISRSSGLVTMRLIQPMPAGTANNTLQVRGVADGTFNGTWTVSQPNPSDFQTWTYVCGGPDTSSSGGSARTTYSDYKDKIHVEILDGNHTETFPGLLASGTSWGANDLCLGRCVAYVRMGYDDAVFPSSIPNVSFVIDGKKDILDPRTNTRGFNNNAALCIADFLSLPTTRGGFGLAIGTDIPTAPLIAAANVCDELVPLAAGGTVKRYTCDTYIPLSTTRGTILKDMLSSCAGRISYQGGQFSIFPAAWVAPTLQISDADLVGGIKLHPRFGIRDTCNALKGTYVSPENAYQQADIPAYMQDARHGYVADPWLAEDRGERIFKEVNLPCTSSSATAQRLLKIALLRTRFQKRVTIQCLLRAYQAVALDVVQFTHPRYNWLNKNFEVLSSRFILDKSNKKAPRPYIELDLAETDPEIYDWSITEQLTPQGYQQPNNVGVRVCAPPEQVTTYSGPGATINGVVYPSTITTGADGQQHNSIYVHWAPCNDANVVFGGHIDVQYQRAGDTAWAGLANIAPTSDHVFIPNVSDGVSYTVQVRNVNCAGVPSEWVQAGAAASNTYSLSSYSGIPQAQNALTGIILAGGKAGIGIANFTPALYAAPCTPSPAEIDNLNQGQLYYVYYVDAAFLGGNITPIVTQDPNDFLNMVGYLLIGSLTTPTGSPTYRPTSSVDQGDRSTQLPPQAYDTSPLTYANVTASNDTMNGQLNGECQFYGFSPVTTSSSATLTVLADLTVPAAANASTIVAQIGGTDHTLLNASTTTAQAAYTVTVAAGTNLASIIVTAHAGPQLAPSGGSKVSLKIYDIKIQ
jgi:hypothetical protein